MRRVTNESWYKWDGLQMLLSVTSQYITVKQLFSVVISIPKKFNIHNVNEQNPDLPLLFPWPKFCGKLEYIGRTCKTSTKSRAMSSSASTLLRMSCICDEVKKSPALSKMVDNSSESTVCIFNLLFFVNYQGINDSILLGGKLLSFWMSFH